MALWVWPLVVGARVCVGRVLGASNRLACGLRAHKLFHTGGNDKPTKNCNEQEESDCLIKTKSSDRVKNLFTEDDFCPVL